MPLATQLRRSLLVLWFIAGGLMIINQTQPTSRYMTLLVLSLGYIIWGIIDQYAQYSKLQAQTCIEYILYAALGLALASSLFYYGI